MCNCSCGTKWSQGRRHCLGKGHWWVVFSIVPSRHSFAWDGRGEIRGQPSYSHHYHHRPSHHHFDHKGKAVVLSLILLSFYAEHHDRRKCVGLRERCSRWERLSRNLDWWRTRWWGWWLICYEVSVYLFVCFFTKNYYLLGMHQDKVFYVSKTFWLLNNMMGLQFFNKVS